MPVLLLSLAQFFVPPFGFGPALGQKLGLGASRLIAQRDELLLRQLAVDQVANPLIERHAVGRNAPGIELSGL
jgi:hypothetical protein